MKRFVLIILAGAVCLPPGYTQTPDEKKATVTYLQGLQTTSGGFTALKVDSKASLRATSSALRALKYNGAAPKEKAAKFVEDCFDKAKGGFSDQPGTAPDVFSTAVGIMAMVELKLPVDSYAEGVVKYLGENAKTFEDIRIAAAGLEAIDKRPEQADAWLEQIGKLRNAAGTFGKGAGAARDTGGAVVAVLRLGGKVEQRDNVVKVLKDGQRADGGFGKEEAKDSDLETTYRVMRAFVMLKEKPDMGKLRGFIARCRNEDGGYGVAPGQKSTVGGTYFAAIILHWLDEK